MVMARRVGVFVFPHTDSPRALIHTALDLPASSILCIVKSTFDLMQFLKNGPVFSLQLARLTTVLYDVTALMGLVPWTSSVYGGLST